MKKILLSILCFCSFLFGETLNNYNNELRVVVDKIKHIIFENKNTPYGNFCYPFSDNSCFQVSFINASKSEFDYPTFTINQIFLNKTYDKNIHLIPDSFIKEPINILILLDKDPKDRLHPISIPYLDLKRSDHPISIPYLDLKTSEFISVNNQNYKEYENQIIFLFNKYYEFLESTFEKNKISINNSLIDLKNIK